MHVALHAGARRLALTHHDPLRDDDGVDGIIDRIRAGLSDPAERALDVFAAAEGQVLELNGDAPRRRTDRNAAGMSAVAAVGPALMGQTVVLGLADVAQTAELAEAMRADGVRVVTVRDGGAALEAARSEHPSLIVLERDLAGQDGLETCHVLRWEAGLAADVPIVMVTPPGAGRTGRSTA